MQCPSLCGEPCPSRKFCFECAPPRVREQVVDYITFSSFQDLAVTKGIILPLSCGHAFTPSFLDGLMELDKFYKVLEPSEQSDPSDESEMTVYGGPLIFKDEEVID